MANRNMKIVLGAAVLSTASAVQAEKWSGCGRLPANMRKIHKTHKKMHSLLEKTNMTANMSNPGDGIDQTNLAPYEESYKDGWAMTACVLDQLLWYGDKYGNGKFAYNGADHNVSIVNYDDIVPKEDREPITHEVCFEFCRTIKNMNFMGLTNGRGCYCSPYFNQQAGDSSACDAPCDGKTDEMCGGKTKSSIFELHSCGDAAENLISAREALVGELDPLGTVSTEVDEAAKAMQAAADELQAAFGNVGDGAASGLCQQAKAFAGELEHPAADGMAHHDEATALTEEADPDGDRAKEHLTADLIKSYAKAEKLGKELTVLHAKGIAPSNIKGEPEKLYYPVMYFVDKEFVDVPSTCGGKLAADPLVGSEKGCAVACETTMSGTGGCVGYQYMPHGDAGLCFLFSEVNTAFYYTGCGSEKLLFLQKKKEAADTKCMLKLQHYLGTSIAPNPSGKCPACLKEATKADRCFE